MPVVGKFDLGILAAQVSQRRSYTAYTAPATIGQDQLSSQIVEHYLNCIQYWTQK